MSNRCFADTPTEAHIEVCRIEFASAAIDNPHHVSVEILPRFHFSRGDRRVLEFEHEAVLSLHVGNVLFVGVPVEADAFMPIARKAIFPVAVPLRFGFPPGIAMHPALVRPMPKPMLAAFRNHRRAAVFARTIEPRHWLTRLAFYYRELHVSRPLEVKA